MERLKRVSRTKEARWEADDRANPAVQEACARIPSLVLLSVAILIVEKCLSYVMASILSCTDLGSGGSRVGGVRESDGEPILRVSTVI